MVGSMKPGDTITGPTPTGEIITGELVETYYTDAEGAPLTGGPSLLVRTQDGRERVVKIAAYEAYQKIDERTEL